jgi:hypothetical protein
MVFEDVNGQHPYHFFLLFQNLSNPGTIDLSELYPFP